MISHEYPPIGGGGANACLHLGKGIAEKGHDVTLVTANYRDMEAVSKENGIKIFILEKHAHHLGNSISPTEISEIYHIDRGYEKIEESFKFLGADIKRVKH